MIVTAAKLVRKVFLFFVIIQLFPGSSCFAQPSEVLLKKLSRNAVEFRKLHLPTLLTPASKNASFVRVIRKTLDELQEQTYESYEQERSILECFLKAEVAIENKDCDRQTKKIIKNLLFRAGDADPQWSSKIEIPNPSYSTVRSEYPDAVIHHDISLSRLVQVLKNRRLGMTYDEEARGGKELASPEDQAVRDRAFSHHLKGYAGTFVEISPNRNASNEKTFWGRSMGAVRLILKIEILRRWDFHITDKHNGGKLVTVNFNPYGDHERGYRSFGPAEVSEYFRHHAQEIEKAIPSPHENAWSRARDEIVFYNPILLSDVKEIVVSKQGLADVREVLDHFHLQIPITVLDDDNIAGIWKVSEIEKARREFETTSGCGPTGGSNPISHLQTVLTKILSSPLIQQEFESFDPPTQERTLQKLRETFKSGDLEILDPEYSLREQVFLKEGRARLQELGKDVQNRSDYEFWYNWYFKKHGDGTFHEAWMRREAENLKPVWEMSGS